MVTGIDRRARDTKGVPLGVGMRNRKLRNIRPSGDFLPEMTSSNFMGPLRSPLEGWSARCAT
jgi:hypothetical protein